MRPKQSVDLTAMTGPGPENGSAGLSDLTEDALALMFTSRHADLLYCHECGKWLRWMDGRWANERTLAVFDLARALTREVSAPDPGPEARGENPKCRDGGRYCVPRARRSRPRAGT
jgi:hypothetical protein